MSKEPRIIGVAYAYPTSTYGGDTGGWFVYTAPRAGAKTRKVTSLFVSAEAAATAIPHVKAKSRGEFITDKYCAVYGERRNFIDIKFSDGTMLSVEKPEHERVK